MSLPLLCILAASAMMSCSFADGKKEGRKSLEEILARHLDGNSDVGVSAADENSAAEEQQMSDKEKYGLPDEGEMPDCADYYYKTSDENSYVHLHITRDANGRPSCSLSGATGTFFYSNMEVEEDQLHWYFKRLFDPMNGLTAPGMQQRTYTYLCVLAKDWTSVNYEGEMYNFLATKDEFQQYASNMRSIDAQHGVHASASASSVEESDDEASGSSQSSRTTPTYRDRKVYRPNMTGDDDRTWCEQCQAWDMPHGHYRERSN